MNFTMEIIVTGLISAFIGGFATFFALMKFSFISTIKEDNERLRERVSELEGRVAVAEKAQIDAKESESYFKNKITLLETAHHDLPFPQWLKDINGVMLSLNSAYEKMFLLPIGKTSEDYIGHTDFDIWPTDIAERFVENDNKAKNKGGYWMGIEPMWLKNSDISPYWRIAKYGRFVGNVCVGIAGIAIPMLDEDVVERPSQMFLAYLIRKDRIGKAFEIINDKAEDFDIKKKAAILESRYSRWKDSDGKMRKDDREIEKTNIVNGLLELIEDL